MGEQVKIPRHVAIIMDGNGRWAKAHGVPRQLGHKKGCETLEQLFMMLQGLVSGI